MRNLPRGVARYMTSEGIREFYEHRDKEELEKRLKTIENEIEKLRQEKDTAE